MQIAIANDHAGVKLKNKIVDFFSLQDIDFINLGSNDLESVDYPDYAHLVVDSIIEGRAQKGILICATGIGMSIAANRSAEIRAALCLNEFMTERARAHNDANVLVLASKITSDKDSIAIVKKFLSTEFEGGRHTKRVEKTNR
ncbi:MAG TPA: ribose 5-phosphate isomerase B [Candidatus Megaira endosymbiont of Nemacystus decipiens]|nr:ribose 5-phosphate isomerase B [Candidatus Megaera endosymbiont of Nemacystus decipiens]